MDDKIGTTHHSDGQGENERQGTITLVKMNKNLVAKYAESR